MERALASGVGACVEALEAHALQLAVDGLDGGTVGAEAGLLGRGVGVHGGLVGGDLADAGIRQDAGLVAGAVVGLVGIDAGTRGQAGGELVDGGQVVAAG